MSSLLVNIQNQLKCQSSADTKHLELLSGIMGNVFLELESTGKAGNTGVLLKTLCFLLHNI